MSLLGEGLRTQSEEILLLCTAGRVKIATPQTSNYFSTKNTLLMAIFTLENSSLLKLERKSLGY